MKRIFLFLVGALAMLSFSQGESFEKSFQQVFSQSIKSLESLKGEAIDGGWKCTVSMPEFDNTMVINDLANGVLGVRFSMLAEDVTVAEQKIARIEPLIASYLPKGDYVRTSTYSSDFEGSMKTVYSFNSEKMSDKQKRPSIEMGIQKTDKGFEAVYFIYEPYFKNQYRPNFGQ